MLNKPNFTAREVIAPAKQHISSTEPSERISGIYTRFDKTNDEVDFWRTNADYVYVGQAVDFKDRFITHRTQRTRYGELARNSRRSIAIAVCVLSETDYKDFCFVAEQIFVCLFHSYREEVLVSGVADVGVDSSKVIAHVDCVRMALRLTAASRQVFQRTGFTGGFNRTGSDVIYGANYTSPLEDWTKFEERTLFVRTDTHEKDRATGRVTPISVFRTAKMKRAHYVQSSNTRSPAEINLCLTVFNKRHKSKDFFKCFFIENNPDGTTAPLPGSNYHVVFEVHTDGSPHSHAWSRLCGIGPYINWDQGRPLAVRVEWEYPPSSGKWRFRYMQAYDTNKWVSVDTVGSSLGYLKTIAMIRWLFDTSYNNVHDWIPRLSFSANVLQAFYHPYTQTVEIRPQAPLKMINGGLRSKERIVSQMSDLGLLNMNGEFGVFLNPSNPSATRDRKLCDTCTLLLPGTRANLPVGCDQMANQNCCRVCWMFGRPCCSWTGAYWISGAENATQAALEGSESRTVERQIVTTNALVAQRRWVDTGMGQGFTQDALHLSSSPSEGEDSVSEDDMDAGGDDEDDIDM
jgi:hypothetical protein